MGTQGSRRRFPKHRETVLDILSQSQRIPSFPVLRKMNLAKVDLARSASPSRIGWTCLFGRAYAMVCEELPELRDLYVSYPFRHLYRHPHSVCSVSVQRKDDNGVERLIWGRWIAAESMTLLDLQKQLGDFRDAPLQQVYREGLALERTPWLLRRWSWWCLMNLSGRKRAKHIGTFSISSLAGHFALNLHHPLITASSLAFGPIDANGTMEVVLIADHRTIDGALAAVALSRLEAKLCGEVLNELQTLGSDSARPDRVSSAA
jgi:hypothetical protein